MATIPTPGFLREAAIAPVDDDQIIYTEDAPDASHGEQAIGPEGVPDAIADAILDDTPAESDTAAAPPADPPAVPEPTVAAPGAP